MSIRGKIAIFSMLSMLTAGFLISGTNYDVLKENSKADLQEQRIRSRAMTRINREKAAKQKEMEKKSSTSCCDDICRCPVDGDETQPDCDFDPHIYYFGGVVPNFANSPLPVIRNGCVERGTGMRKFVDSLPGLNPENANNLGNYIPIAVANTSAFPGSDYYELSIKEYQQQLHSDLGQTQLRGYSVKNQVAHYLGPLIIAKTNIPVRLRVTNDLPSGKLFLPVDTSIPGAGFGPNGPPEIYTQNRTSVHLHGGLTPWISDGGPLQWFTPAGEVTSYPRGDSFQQVSDMGPFAPGEATFYYTNYQSARLMWFHDHAQAITRLNVYAGMAAGYLLIDDQEEMMINEGIIPGKDFPAVYRYGIPLIIQDKTFVPPSQQLCRTDPTWHFLPDAGYPVGQTVGSLWLPHVYMPNQNPNDNDTGVNPMGRWDYGPWVWPPFNAGAGLENGPLIDSLTNDIIPGTPNPSITPEYELDTPLVNGCAYPYLEVDRKPYRFRVLNACNDRFLNLQLYFAEPLSVSITDGGCGYSEVPKVQFIGKACESAKGIAIVENCKVVGVQITDYGSGYKEPPKVVFCGGGKNARGAHAITSLNTEVKMVPACPQENFPAFYPTADGRVGGFPDPANIGPSMIQIGTEGGFLPKPVVLFNRPVGYEYDRRSFTVLNVLEKALFLGPAERADIIVDFSKVPKNVSTVILYNDAPAPVPGFDPRLDYFTNDPDRTSTGGAPSTLAGYGPNTRTVMQFRLTHVRGEEFDLAPLEEELPKVFAASQPAPIVLESTYPAPYTAPHNTYAEIQNTFLTYRPLGSANDILQPLLPKAIIESFDTSYGRMNSVLGAELAFTNDGVQTSVPLAYRDPPTENFAAIIPFQSGVDNETQLWKITHNGVDTHAIHFHLFNVQLVNRVGWDGVIKAPDDNELGWKETVRMNPLEDTIVAIRPVTPPVPQRIFVPESTRLLDPTIDSGDTWRAFKPAGTDAGTAVTITNQRVDFAWEYVWHCHLLGHEENDMMRPITFGEIPTRPFNVSAAPNGAAGSGQVLVSWNAPTNLGFAGSVIGYTVTAVAEQGGSVVVNPNALVNSPITTGVTPNTVALTPGTEYYFVVTAVTNTTTGGPAAPGPGYDYNYQSQPSLLSNLIQAP